MKKITVNDIIYSDVELDHQIEIIKNECLIAINAALKLEEILKNGTGFELATQVMKMREFWIDEQKTLNTNLKNIFIDK